MMWNAVVLAGGVDPKSPLARASLTPYPAFAPVGPRRLAVYPLFALADAMAAGRIGRIAVSAPENAPALDPGPWDRIASGETAGESAAIAFEAMGAPLLIVSAGAALLSADIICDFLDAAEAGPEATIALTPAERAAKTPEAPPRPELTLKEGPYLSTGLAALATTGPKGAFDALTAVERRGPARALKLLTASFRPPSIAAAAKALSKLTQLETEITVLEQPDSGFLATRALDLIYLRRLEAGLEAPPGENPD